jgi:hypothetical protein
MIRVKNQKVIDVGDFDALVEKTYGRPFSFQQQDGCKERQRVHITVPEHDNDFQNDTIPEEVNGEEMGVSFAAWLARDPKAWSVADDYPWRVRMFWERNFYPDVQMVVNDLHAKGLFPAGEYVIDIDW